MSKSNAELADEFLRDLRASGTNLFFRVSNFRPFETPSPKLYISREGKVGLHCSEEQLHQMILAWLHREGYPKSEKQINNICDTVKYLLNTE